MGHVQPVCQPIQLCHGLGQVPVRGRMDPGANLPFPESQHLHPSVNRDAYGRQLSPETRMEMLRLRKWQIRTRVHSSSDRNLAQAMAELDRLTDRLHIPAPIKESAAIVYRKALDSGLVRGRSIAAIAAASLYAACRSSETPRTLKEVSAASRIKKKDVARCYRLLLRELEMSMPVEDPVRCISKIARRAEITIQTQQSAIQV